MSLDPIVAAGLALVLALAALIDLKRMILPDYLTLPLIPLGWAISVPGAPDLTDRVIGSAAGFVAFAGIAALYRRLRGRDGLGLGDAKLLAAAGAWVGWRDLPSVVLLAAVAALAWALATRRDPDLPLPFGPFLAASFWLVRQFGGLAMNYS